MSVKSSGSVWSWLKESIFGKDKENTRIDPMEVEAKLQKEKEETVDIPRHAMRSQSVYMDPRSVPVDIPKKTSMSRRFSADIDAEEMENGMAYKKSAQKSQKTGFFTSAQATSNSYNPSNYAYSNTAAKRKVNGNISETQPTVSKRPKVVIVDPEPLPKKPKSARKTTPSQVADMEVETDLKKTSELHSKRKRDDLNASSSTFEERREQERARLFEKERLEEKERKARREQEQKNRDALIAEAHARVQASIHENKMMAAKQEAEKNKLLREAHCKAQMDMLLRKQQQEAERAKEAAIQRERENAQKQFIHEEKMRMERAKAAAAEEIKLKKQREEVTLQKEKRSASLEIDVQERIDRRRKSMDKRQVQEHKEQADKEAIVAKVRPVLLSYAKLLTPEQFLKKCVPNVRTDDNLKASLKRALAKLHPDRSRHFETLQLRVEAEELYKIILGFYEAIDK